MERVLKPTGSIFVVLSNMEPTASEYLLKVLKKIKYDEEHKGETNLDSTKNTIIDNNTDKKYNMIYESMLFKRGCTVNT